MPNSKTLITSVLGMSPSLNPSLHSSLYIPMTKLEVFLSLSLKETSDQNNLISQENPNHQMIDSPFLTLPQFLNSSATHSAKFNSYTSISLGVYVADDFFLDINGFKSM